MRSLKIIVFRDTDKPYTMILSAPLLVGISFGILALGALLTFSVMSNVMLYAQAGEMAVAPAEPALTESGQQVTEDPGVTDLTSEEITEQPADQTEENPVTEEPAETPAAEQPPVLADLHPQDGELEISPLESPVIGTSSITLRALLSKRINPGVSARGRFVAFLVDRGGNFGPSYPAGVTVQGDSYSGLEATSNFRISYRRGYEVRFNNIDPSAYVSIALCIFEFDTHQLLWRTIVPLQQ